MKIKSVTSLIGDRVLRVEDGNHGENRPRKDEFGSGSLKFIRAVDLIDGVVNFVSAELINDVAAERVRKGFGRDGDTILSHKGTVGKVAYVPHGSPKFVCSPQTTFWRSLDVKILDERFLNFALRSPFFQGQLASISTESDMAPYVSLTQQKKLQLPLPTIEAQRAIGEVLGALDDKIAANRRVVAACDELRSQLWNSACASDRTERPLSSIARFVNGRAFTKDASGTGRVVIRIAELNSGIGASTVRSDIQVADDHVAGPGDLLLAWSGSLTFARWFREEAIVNQHIFKVVPNRDSETWAVASAVDSKLADFKEIAKDKATTMGHIRRADLDQPVGWPAVPAEVGEAGQTLWSRALSAEMENEVLARTRDELLPLLMSGRITVKDAEQAAEAVL